MQLRNLSEVLAIGVALSLTTPTRAGLVGHWRLDGNASDSTSNHTAVVFGSHIAWPTSDKAAGSGSLQLNSGNQSDTWIQIADKADLQFGTNDFSVSYWVKKLHASANFSDTYGVDKWRSGAIPGQNEWFLSVSSDSSPVGDDKPTFGIENTGGAARYAISSSSNMTLSVWHFLVGVRRQSVIEVYVDGVLAGRVTIPAGTAINNVAGGRDLYIGISAQPGQFGANALYDDVQIYNHALGNGGVNVGETAGGEIAFLFNHPGFDAVSPYFVTQPDNQAVLAGSAATFSVVATNGTLSYQWRLNTTNFIAWGTNATLTITNVASSDLGFYDVIVSNLFASVPSARAKLSFPQLGIERLPGNTIQVVIEGAVGTNARVDWSTNLADWDVRTNLALPSNPFKFIDASAPAQATRFYRALFQY